MAPVTGAYHLQQFEIARAAGQRYFALGFATNHARSAKAFIKRQHRFPAERRKQPDGGLFGKLVFGVGVGHDYSVTRSYACWTKCRAAGT